MRGSVLQYDDTSGAGLISGDDGVRYTFKRADLQQLRPVTAGMRVDFIHKDGLASEIYIIDAATGAAASGGGTTGGTTPAVAYTGEDRGLWSYFLKVMAKSFDGNGRARRKEIWSFALFVFLIMSVIYIPLVFMLAGTVSSAAFSYSYGYGYENAAGLMALITSLGAWVYLILIVSLVFIPASITVTIRRLHDIGFSGWLVLLWLIPYLGGLFLFICALIPSQATVNKHGAIPKPQPQTLG